MRPTYVDSSIFCYMEWLDWMLHACVKMVMNIWLLVTLPPVVWCPRTTWTRLVDYGCSRPKANQSSSGQGHATLLLWTAGVWFYRRLRGLSIITLVSSYSPFIVDTVQQLITISIRLCWWQPGAPSILTFNIANNILFIPLPPDIMVTSWHFPADITSHWWQPGAPS